MQKTTSERFTSLKKKAAPQNIKMNKFSSSGIGHFNVNAGKHLPPTSPTPTTGQVIRDGIARAKPTPATGMTASAVDDQTELIDQTNDHFVEFDLKLNNQDQFNSGAEDESCSGDEISENIVTESIASSHLNVEANKKIQENLRKKLLAKKEELEKERLKIMHQNTCNDSVEGDEGSGSKSAQPRFGTQIVNYQPNFVENSQTPSDDSDERNNEMASQAKTTFQGRNFGPAKIQQDPTPTRHPFRSATDQKENENSANRGGGHFANANKLDFNNNITDPAMVITRPENMFDPGDSQIISESSNYDRLQSTRQHISYLSKNRDHKRGFSPPIKMKDEAAGKAASILQNAMMVGTDESQLDLEKARRQAKTNIKIRNPPVDTLDMETSSFGETQTDVLVERRLTHSSHYRLKPGVALLEASRQDDADETIIFDKQEPPVIEEQETRPKKALIRVQKVDMLRDSLEGDDCLSASQNDELAQQVKAGVYPKNMFCLVEKTGELVDVEFDEMNSKLYVNMATKEYYRPIIL